MKALLLALALTLTGCAGSQAQAKCSGIRVLYDRGQSELIDRGLCDDHDSVSTCLPHVALREAFVASLKESGCGS